MTQPQRIQPPSQVIAARRIGGRLPAPPQSIEIVNQVLTRTLPPPSWAATAPPSSWTRLLSWFGLQSEKLVALLEAPMHDMTWMWNNVASITRSVLLLLAPFLISYAVVYPVSHLPPSLKIFAFMATSVLGFVVMSWILFILNGTLDGVGRFWGRWKNRAASHD